MARRNDNEYVDMDVEKLMKLSEELKDKLFEALKETDVNESDLWELLEMERELTLREEIG